METLAVISLIFGIPILIVGAIEFGKGEGGFLTMLFGCWCIYNGVVDLLPSNDKNKEIIPVEVVIENKAECLPIAKAEYLNVFGFLDARYKKCENGKIEVIDESDFNKLTVSIDENLVSKKEIIMDVVDKILLPITMILFMVAFIFWIVFRVVVGSVF
ncbi:hypothetical protein [Providencia alcalifaciens]|uniref:hypothetical protein n=1 Tax=Providencia alcalifaciens TaxID=126385 RepID=UPI002B055FB3|nr:hypothetical protein [Providencia alcalifaciens]